MKRKVAVVTGTRAEYGLLYWLMKEIQEDCDLELQVVVTGAHLSPEFGFTYDIIEKDGFAPLTKVEMLLSSDSATGIAKSMGVGVLGFAETFASLQPDLMVVMGDRYEVLAAVQTAMVQRIPIAHISGGERSEGAIDEAIRHSITKMSHLHFVAAEEYRRRVVQLGEMPNRVFNFGEPGLDNINRLALLDRSGFEEAIDWELGETTFLATYHPVTLSDKPPEESMAELIRAFEAFPEARIILTAPNADSGGRMIRQVIDDYAARRPERIRVYTSLGQLRYLSAIMHADVVIGNSSSGLVEVPAMKKPTVNIGDRQNGRLKATSVIDTLEDGESIVAGIQKALSDDFQKTLAETESLYGDGRSSVRIKDKLKEVDLVGILRKEFHDIPFALEDVS